MHTAGQNPSESDQQRQVREVPSLALHLRGQGPCGLSGASPEDERPTKAVLETSRCQLRISGGKAVQDSARA